MHKLAILRKKQNFVILFFITLERSVHWDSFLVFGVGMDESSTYCDLLLSHLYLLDKWFRRCRGAEINL